MLQKLQLDHDAAVHKQQLQMEKQQHALQLSQEALANAQAEALRLQQQHAQERALSEVRQRPAGILCNLRDLLKLVSVSNVRSDVCSGDLSTLPVMSW